MKCVLDTNIVLYWLSGRLADPLPAADCCVSVISEIELLSYPFSDPGDEGSVRAFLGTVEIVPLSPPVVEKTIAFRRSRTLKLPDAIIAATALTLGVELYSNDETLLRVPGLRAARLGLKQL